MDIGLLNPSPMGVNFMPSSPPPQAQSDILDCWPEGEDLNQKFMDMVVKIRGLQLLTSTKRSDCRHYLNNRSITQYSSNKAQRQQQAQVKHWALTYFELQDNQVYRKPEQRPNGTWYQARYAACVYDALEIIQKSHCNLIHACKF